MKYFLNWAWKLCFEGTKYNDMILWKNEESPVELQEYYQV